MTLSFCLTIQQIFSVLFYDKPELMEIYTNFSEESDPQMFTLNKLLKQNLLDLLGYVKGIVGVAKMDQTSIKNIQYLENEFLNFQVVQEEYLGLRVFKGLHQVYDQVRWEHFQLYYFSIFTLKQALGLDAEVSKLRPHKQVERH